MVGPMTIAGVAVAAVIAWVRDARVRRWGAWILLVIGLRDAALRAWPDGGDRAGWLLAGTGVLLLAIATAAAALADRRRAGRDRPAQVTPLLRPRLPGVALATVAAIVVGVGGHAAALLLAAIASGWGAWLAVPVGHRPAP